MTLDYEKLIEAMAIAKYNEPNHFKKDIWEKCPELTKKIFQESAKIVFAALQNNLPEITLNLHEDLTLNEEKAKLWDGLKNLGR